MSAPFGPFVLTLDDIAKRMRSTFEGFTDPRKGKKLAIGVLLQEVPIAGRTVCDAQVRRLGEVLFGARDLALHALVEFPLAVCGCGGEVDAVLTLAFMLVAPEFGAALATPLAALSGSHPKATVLPLDYYFSIGWSVSFAQHPKNIFLN